MAEAAGLVLDIPGSQRICLRHLLLDFNGTLARDGVLLRGVGNKLRRLQNVLAVEVLTGDLYGTARRSLGPLGIPITIVGSGAEKAARVLELGAEGVVAVGNGNNDIEMFRQAGLSICVHGPEGSAGTALSAATLVFPGIGLALDALLCPARLVASLRR